MTRSSTSASSSRAAPRPKRVLSAAIMALAAPLVALLVAAPAARAQSSEPFTVVAAPPSASCAGGGPTVSELVAREPGLGFLAKAIEAAGFDATLRGQYVIYSPSLLSLLRRQPVTDPFFFSLCVTFRTFVAPVDAAWTKLTALEKQQQQRGGASASAQVPSVFDMDLSDLLEGHLMEGPFSQADAEVVGANVIKRIDSCNGEIALIDKVLLPSNIGGGGGGRGRCKPGHCCDIEPPGDFGCADQLAWDKCEEAWMMEGGFCRASCGHCSVHSIRDASVGHHAPTAFVNEGILYQQWWYVRRNLSPSPLPLLSLLSLSLSLSCRTDD